jgi:hypothetical protein
MRLDEPRHLRKCHRVQQSRRTQQPDLSIRNLIDRKWANGLRQDLARIANGDPHIIDIQVAIIAVSLQ